MTRHDIREEVFKIIFGVGFHGGEDMEALVDTYLADSCDYELKDEEKKEIRDKAVAVISKLPELDESIDKIAESGWTTARMGKAELNILRLAVYEIRYDQEVPVKVAINEAVELAKEYCGDDAPAFVNGVLAHFA